MSFTKYENSVIKYKLGSKVIRRQNTHAGRGNILYPSRSRKRSIFKKTKSELDQVKKYCITNNYKGFLINRVFVIYFTYINIDKIEKYNKNLAQKYKKYPLKFPTDLYILNFNIEYNNNLLKLSGNDTLQPERKFGPNFLIIGIQKSGTEYLKYLLRHHPDIYMPKKEIHFFSTYREYQKGTEYYESFFVGKKQKLLGEKTPDYIIKEEFLKRIYNYYPDMKIIITFSNPITRLYSNWNHFNQESNKFKKNFPLNKTFKETIALANDDYFLDRGFYYTQLANVYKYFPKKNVHIQIKERFNIPELFKFLEVDNVVPQKVIDKKIHKRTYTTEISYKMVEYLRNIYTEEIEKFYKLIGFRIKEWDDYFNYFGQTFKLVKHINIKKINISCFIVCVNYSDFLKITLPINCQYINDINIITDFDDKKTEEICKKYNVNVIKTDSFYRNKNNEYKKSIFNKGKAINFGLKNHQNINDNVLLIDADIILNKKIVDIDLPKLDNIYGTERIIFTKQIDWAEVKNSYIEHLPHKLLCIGFFQLFNIKSKCFIKNFYGYAENISNASGSDLSFANKWKKEVLDFPIVHLGETETNWNGRITEFWN